MREDFLKSHWRPYPEASRPTWSLSRWMGTFGSSDSLNGPDPGEPVYFGGKITSLNASLLNRGCFEISGQGHRALIHFEGQVPLVPEWTSPNCFCGEDILREGDQVLIQVRQGGVNWNEKEKRLHLYKVEKVVLAAPCQQNYQPKLARYEVSDQWAYFLSMVRQFFRLKGLSEVFTPSLVVCPGMEPTLEPFATSWKWGNQQRPFFLPTSPELHLKKLMSQGWTDFYEIKPCYRNDELTDHHQPEFLMLEWYRAFAHLSLIEDDFIELVHFLYQNQLVTGSLPEVQRASMADLFQEHLNFQLQPHTTRRELIDLAGSQKLPIPSEESWDDLFFLLFVTFVEPKIDPDVLLILKDFPASQAALSRLKKEGWADRQEFYWRGLELGNAFHELNDPQVQRQRFEKDDLERQQRGRTEVPIDREFLLSLESGMPPAGGIAVGLDRLFLACQNKYSLQEIRHFPKQWSEN